jgi:hypothetical protein
VAIWLVELSEARIWRHYHPELVEIFDHGMMFKEGRYPVHQMLKHTNKDSMKKIGYNNSCWRDECYISEDAF